MIQTIIKLSGLLILIILIAWIGGNMATIMLTSADDMDNFIGIIIAFAAWVCLVILSYTFYRKIKTKIKQI